MRELQRRAVPSDLRLFHSLASTWNHRETKCALMDKAIGWGARWTSVQKADTHRACAENTRRTAALLPGWEKKMGSRLCQKVLCHRRISEWNPLRHHQRSRREILFLGFVGYRVCNADHFFFSLLWKLPLANLWPAGFQLGIWNEPTRLSTEDGFPGRKLSPKSDF